MKIADPLDKPLKTSKLIIYFYFYYLRNVDFKAPHGKIYSKTDA